MEKVQEEVTRLATRMEKMASEFDQHAARTARLAALQEIQSISTSIDDRIDKRLRTALIFVSVLLALFSAMGYLGLQTTLPKVVEAALGTSAKQELEELRAYAASAVEEIRAAHDAVQSPALIVLLTDYGPEGPYMGALIGKIYQVNPHAQVTVATSSIDNFNPLDAAWVLWRTSRYYPRGTIFVVIANPGGVTRNPRLIVTKNGHLYIGHDNGCFDFVVKEHGLVAAYTIASPELTPARLSDAFGGVDLIGPAAAKLASGFPIEKVGPSEDSYEPKLRAIRHEVNRRLRRIEASVLHVDKFGNATTNIQKQDLDDIGLGVGDELAVEIGGRFFLGVFRV